MTRRLQMRFERSILTTAFALVGVVKNAFVILSQKIYINRSILKSKPENKDLR
jgi:hypothetical protein